MKDLFKFAQGQRFKRTRPRTKRVLVSFTAEQWEVMQRRAGHTLEPVNVRDVWLAWAEGKLDWVPKKADK